MKFPSLPLGAMLFVSVLVGSDPAQAQTYNWKRVQIHGGGFVTGIIPHPNAAGVMYCRTDVGGAYRWNPTNDSWIQLLDFLGPANEEWSLSGIESIALDPQDANRLYMTCGWLGVGRPNAVLISTNQGASFTRVNAPFTMLANNDGRGNGERLAVDPNLGSILFNGTRLDGLWKSVNYGANWTKVTSFPVNTTTNSVGLVFVEFIKSSGVNGSATPVIFVGVSQGGTNIYRSADGGATWTGITNGAASNYMPHRAAQDGLGNMYITFNDAAGPNDVGAGSVRKLNLATLASINVTPPTGQGGFSGVSVDKQNPNRVVVSTANRWWPNEEVYRSTNGGTNWTAIYTGATIDASSAPWITHGAATAPVPTWIADIKIDPFNSNRVYHVSGWGIYSSYNLTATTPSWQFRSDGIEEMGLWGGGSALCSPPSGPSIFTAFGDIGGFADYNPDVSPPNTNHFYPTYASNTSVDFAELNPNLVVRTHWGAPRGSRSTDAGRTWTDFPTHPSATDTNPGAIAISADGGRLVWSSPGFPASYSTNNGATWSVCGGSITPTYVWEQPFLFSDRVNSNKFYLYMPSTGKISISTDGGANFTAGPTIGLWGDGLRTVYGYEGHVWMACTDGNSANAGLWRSTNSGASFTRLPGIQNASCVGFGRTASGSGYPVIYLAGQVSNTWGIYRSENQGTNWTRINDDQHQYGLISQITGDPRIYGRCYIGEAGMLYGDIPNVPPFAPTGLTANPSNAAISLTWNTAIGADSYIVKRASVSGGPYNSIASGLTSTSYMDTGLVNGTTYYYVVAATNVYGVSPDSAEASATPMMKLTGAIIGSSGSWSNSGNTATNVFDGNTNTFYDAVNATGDWAGLDLGSGTNGVVMQIKYCPRAGWAGRMVGGQFQGANVADFSSGVTTFFTVASTPSEGTMTVQAVTNASSFRYLRYTGPAGAYCNVAEVEFDGLYAVVPSVPTNLSATIGDASVALSWSASSNATSYYVKRSTVSGSGYTAIATNASVAFTNSGLANGTLYYFVVSAVNASGESTNSTEVSARPTSSASVAISVTNLPGQLLFGWPADHTGWQLQAQTNTLTSGLGTNWVNVTGADQTNQMSVPLDSMNCSVFFRLARPY
jgi:hypothetical protein